jgi:hypothetical protein
MEPDPTADQDQDEQGYNEDEEAKTFQAKTRWGLRDGIQAEL